MSGASTPGLPLPVENIPRENAGVVTRTRKRGDALSRHIETDIRSCERLSLVALRANWRRRWGQPPQLRSRALLLYATAYRLQIEAFGDGSASVRRRLADLGRRFDSDRSFCPQPGPVLRPGCSLVREWRGVRHEVKITDTGFSYQGKAFTSLSRVAEHITGVKRSGVLFFGLRSEVRVGS